MDRLTLIKNGLTNVWVVSTCSQIVSRAPYIANIKGGKNSMKIIVTSIFVQDQDKALEFYSETLGFVKKHDVPMRRI